MKNATEFLDEAKKKLGIVSDAELAKALKIKASAISNYRNGERVMDNYTATKTAEILGISPIEIIAVANMEREKDEGKKEFWKGIITKYSMIAILALPSPDILAPALHQGQVEMPTEYTLCAIRKNRKGSRYASQAFKRIRKIAQEIFSQCTGMRGFMWGIHPHYP